MFIPFRIHFCMKHLILYAGFSTIWSNKIQAKFKLFSSHNFKIQAILATVYRQVFYRVDKKFSEKLTFFSRKFSNENISDQKLSNEIRLKKTFPTIGHMPIPPSCLLKFKFSSIFSSLKAKIQVFFPFFTNGNNLA